MTSFADLHRPGEPFVLPNAWDVGSARALVAAGFAAVGTTSLGVASSHGLPDASRAATNALLAMSAELVRADLGCFLTCDVEDGLSDDPGEVADIVERLGVDGVNLEDATRGHLVEPEAHARKVRAVKERCPDVFVNARTDMFWLGEGDVADAVARATRYVDAGADGVFLPGDLDEATIEAFTRDVAAPVNVLASGSVPYHRLARAGVARISTGSLLYRAALSEAVEAARRVRDGRALPRAMGYADVQALHERVTSQARTAPPPRSR
jgi:2-methylisocitrate lyase-like PEP mutase family enzyme